MKQSQVKPGVRALLSLGGRRGAVAVTVVCRWTPERAGDVRWCVRDSSGVERTVTPRQLRPLPVTDASGKLIGYAEPAFDTFPDCVAGRTLSGSCVGTCGA